MCDTHVYGLVDRNYHVVFHFYGHNVVELVCSFETNPNIKALAIATGSGWKLLANKCSDGQTYIY